MSSAASTAFGETCPRTFDPQADAGSPTRPCANEKEAYQRRALSRRTTSITAFAAPDRRTWQNQSEKPNHFKWRCYPSTTCRRAPTRPGSARRLGCVLERS